MSLRKIVLLLAAGFSTGVVMAAAFGQMGTRSFTAGEAGLFPGNAVDIETSTDGTVTIKPSAPCCRFCGTVENVIIADNVIICRKCAEKLLAKVDKTDD